MKGRPFPGKKYEGRWHDCRALKFRGFISVDIRPSQTLVAMLEQLRQTRADLKVVKAQNLHLTLKFLGDTDEALVDGILERIQHSSEGIRPFGVKLQGMGAFPSMSNIRVVWIGIEDGKPLTEMASRLDSSLNEMGFERDRRGFKPHLTVARARGGKGMALVQDIITANAATDFGDCWMDRVILKKSVLTPKGPEYSDVRDVVLADAR